MKIEPIAPAHMEGFRALFDAAGSACGCRFWHFEGNKNEWLARCAYRPDENFEEQSRAVASRDPTGDGLVAIDDDGRVIGWMKLAPRASMTKLTSRGIYRGAAPAPDTYVVGCFLVHPEARRRGVARALTVAAEAHVRALGGTAIEAFPHRANAPLHDEEAWQGPAAMFLGLGYTEADSLLGPPTEVAYPLLRKSLVPGKP
jgi:GNAT superfamily N-acetyltransferase